MSHPRLKRPPRFRAGVARRDPEMSTILEAVQVETEVVARICAASRSCADSRTIVPPRTGPAAAAHPGSPRRQLGHLLHLIGCGLRIQTESGTSTPSRQIAQHSGTCRPEDLMRHSKVSGSFSPEAITSVVSTYPGRWNVSLQMPACCRSIVA